MLGGSNTEVTFQICQCAFEGTLVLGVELSERGRPGEAGENDGKTACLSSLGGVVYEELLMGS